MAFITLFFSFGCAGSHCHAGLLSVLEEGSFSLAAPCGHLPAVPSPVAEHRL